MKSYSYTLVQNTILIGSSIIYLFIFSHVSPFQITFLSQLQATILMSFEYIYTFVYHILVKCMYLGLFFELLILTSFKISYFTFIHLISIF